jgi:hypothetical protein
MGGMFAGQPDGVLAADDPDIFAERGGSGSSFWSLGEVVARGADFVERAGWAEGIFRKADEGT